MKHPCAVLLLLAAMLACAGHMPAEDASQRAGSDTTAVAIPEAPIVRVGAKKGRTYANIRMFSDDKSPVLTTVPVGTELKCYGSDGKWRQVQVPDSGALGWIHTVYLEK